MTQINGTFSGASPIVSATLAANLGGRGPYSATGVESPTSLNSVKSTNDKAGLGSLRSEPVTFQEIESLFQSRYPGHEMLVEGDLHRGLIAYSSDINSPTKYLTLASSAFFPLKVTRDAEGNRVDVEFGKVGSLSDVKFPMTVYQDERADRFLQSLDTYLRTTNDSFADLDESIVKGALFVGFERESWIPRKSTGELVREPLTEVFEGQLEIDDGKYAALVSAARGIAQSMVDYEPELREKLGHEDYLNVGTSTFPCGTPDETKIDIADKYMFAISRRLFKVFESRSDEATQVMDQVAKAHGYDSFVEMKTKHDDYRTWVNAAAHLNVGVLNFIDEESGENKMDVDLMVDLSKLLFSELGSIARLLTASGPYIFGVAPEVNGVIPRDTREIIRNLLGTAEPVNQPIRGAHHLLDILKQTTTAGEVGADRLDRAGAVHTENVVGEDGVSSEIYSQTAHSSGRLRQTQTDEASGRVEFTASGASSALFKVRAMAFFQVFQGITIAARAKGQTVFEYIFKKTGIDESEVFGSAEEVVQAYIYEGAESDRVESMVSKLRQVIESFDEYPVFDEVKSVALAALDSFKLGGSFEDLTKNGYGTLGEVLSRIAGSENPLTGFEIATLVDAYQAQEQHYLTTWDDARIELYLLGGEGSGFDFIWPDNVPKVRL